MLEPSPFLQTLLQHSTDGILAFDCDCRYTLWNPVMERISGFRSEQVLGRRAVDVFPFLKEIGEDGRLLEALAGNAVTSREGVYSIPETGHSGSFEGRYFPHLDVTGEIVGGLGIIRDITAERQVRAHTEATQRDVGRLELVMDGLPALICFIDRERRCQLLNRAFAERLGSSRAELIGRPVREVVGETTWQAISPYMDRVLAGEPVSFERFLPLGKNPHRWLSSAYAPHYNEQGEIQGFVALIHDVTVQRSAEERQRVLAEASRLLSSSLDYQTTLQQVARLALPHLADFCYVDVVEGGQIRRIAAAHADPDQEVVLRELQDRYPPDWSSPAPAARVLRSREPELLPTVDEAVAAAHTTDAEHLALIRRLGIRSHLAVPLIARGELVGAISLALTGQSRRYGADDLALAVELAQRAAVAVDNARLYRAAKDEISERKALERQLRASEEQFRSLVEQSPLSIQMLSPTGETVQVNPAWERLWGSTLQHLQDLGYNLLQDPQLVGNGLMPYIRQAFDGQPAVIPPIGYDRAETLPHLVGDPQPKRWVRANIYPVHDGAGNLEKVVLVHEDYTDRKLLEDALEERMEALAQADRRKDVFLAMLGHELRNPLGAVTTALHVLSRAEPGTPAYDRAREIALRQVLHQTRIVEDLLDVSRIAQGKIEVRRERLDLASLVRGISEDQRANLEAAGLWFTLQVPDYAVPLLGDRTRLTQVVENLLENARKFTPAGGSVSVSLAADQNAREATLHVRDTGVGIDQATFAHLFEPFTQADRSLERSPGGLGLGLSLVKGLVELHGGSVVALSNGLGRGAEFTISLPLAPEPEVLQSVAAVCPAALGQLRILVVEDNQDAAETLRDLLQLSGYSVGLAHTGPQGLEMALTFQPEIILCDIGLPGLSGYEVAAALRRQAETAGLRLIAVTGYGSAADQERSRVAGFDLHLTKPVHPQDLHQALAKAMRS
ncbi:MAG: PAS domain-containing protein [Actinomycetota bacterium]